MPSFTPQAFVAKWHHIDLTEKAAAQEHFLDLCRLIGHPTPAEDDPTGEHFTFEAGVSKQGGGQGWADVWKKGYFAWEYKGKDKDLDKAYDQLLLYRESLQNPPLLVVCDIERIVIHTNFTNTVKQVTTLALDDLLNPQGLTKLRAVFYHPQQFRSPETSAGVTEKVAAEFAQLADRLRQYGYPAPQVAHFLIRLLFCLFAEDVELLPDNLFTRLVHRTRPQPKVFSQQLSQLFATMVTGGWFGTDAILQFNGGLFNDDATLELDTDGMAILDRVTRFDWAAIEPSIFGTLFIRSLDPTKRSQLGAHYTSREDILLIVEPVLMAPLRRRWATVEAQAREMAIRRDTVKGAEYTKLHNRLRKLLVDFAAELALIRILDPACGSGNFLYVALILLLDLWKEVFNLMLELGLTAISPILDAPSPLQLHGIEIDPYAHDLAQTTIWIGYIQWFRNNGFGVPGEPILKPIETIRQMDAILTQDDAGTPFEPIWPPAEIIIGNPPFLGGKRLRTELGDEYVNDLFALYEGKTPHEADLVCYWFERARMQIEDGKAKRAGLLATQAIRGGANRKVLQRIIQTGGIFWAQSDRDWILDGATVHVSMVGFDDGSDADRVLDGVGVQAINANLTGTIDLTTAKQLRENLNLVYMGDTKGGSFDISGSLAANMLRAPLNPNGRPNSDVVRPWINALDITRRPREMWIVDFGVEMTADQAALYEQPFEYVQRQVKPERLNDKRLAYGERWWLHTRARPAMRTAIARIKRYFVTPAVAKHRIFAWAPPSALPDHALFVFASDDDYFFGVLHSRAHELWALRLGTSLEDRPRYTPTTTFETFPFPWPPGKESTHDPRVQAIVQAARELVEKRDAWLNPPGSSEAELKKRTLTNLYNRRPAWLDFAHRKLDEAVFAAYGWPSDLSDDEILSRLLTLNLERSSN